MTVTSAQPLDNKLLGRLESAVTKSAYVGKGKTLKVKNEVRSICVITGEVDQVYRDNGAWVWLDPLTRRMHLAVHFFFGLFCCIYTRAARRAKYTHTNACLQPQTAMHPSIDAHQHYTTIKTAAAICPRPRNMLTNANSKLPPRSTPISWAA